MANSSHLPTGNLRELRPGLPKEPPVSGPRAVQPPRPLPEPAPEAALEQVEQTGPRKLVRPKLPAGVTRPRSSMQRTESPISAHQTAPITHADASSHAETFYFQKQVQTQTLMVFVLENGEQVEGYIEWYDRDVVKIRNGRRTLIYKSAIKYLYKAGEIPGAPEGHTNNR